MHLADTASLATAIPALTEALNAKPIELKFALTVYLIVSAVVLPASGWIADRWGARRVFLVAQSVFLTGSLLCALSNNIEQLIASRVVQGLGGGILMSVSRVIIVKCSERSELLRTLNMYAIAGILGPLLGPPLAGFLVEFASWRWIFVINIPVALIGIIGVLKLVPSLKQEDPGRFDLKGTCLAAIGILGLMALAETAGLSLLSKVQLSLLTLITLFFLTAAIRHARRVKNPALELRLLEIKTYRACMIGSGFLRLSFGATAFMLPLLLQSVFGWSPFESGMALFCGALGAIAGRFASTVVIRHLGFRMVTAVFAGASALASTFPAFLQTSTPAIIIFLLMILASIFRTTHFAASIALSFSEISTQFTSRASSLNIVVQQLIQSLGISIAALMLISSINGSEPLTAESFFLPFLILGLIGVLAVPIFLALPTYAGENLERRTINES